MLTRTKKNQREARAVGPLSQLNVDVLKHPRVKVLLERRHVVRDSLEQLEREWQQVDKQSALAVLDAQPLKDQLEAKRAELESIEDELLRASEQAAVDIEKEVVPAYEEALRDFAADFERLTAKYRELEDLMYRIEKGRSANGIQQTYLYKRGSTRLTTPRFPMTFIFPELNPRAGKGKGLLDRFRQAGYLK